MAKMTFPYACARLKDYFFPLGFEADLESPQSMSARVYDPKTGEDLAFVSGLPWTAVMTNEGLVKIIGALEHEMELKEFVHTPVQRGA